MGQKSRFNFCDTFGKFRQVLIFIFQLHSEVNYLLNWSQSYRRAVRPVKLGTTTLREVSILVCHCQTRKQSIIKQPIKIQVRGTSIAMSVSVCLSVCLSARICQKPHVQTLENFPHVSVVAVARSSSDDNALCCVLPVL